MGKIGGLGRFAAISEKVPKELLMNKPEEVRLKNSVSTAIRPAFTETVCCPKSLLQPQFLQPQRWFSGDVADVGEIANMIFRERPASEPEDVGVNCRGLPAGQLFQI